MKSNKQKNQKIANGSSQKKAIVPKKPQTNSQQKSLKKPITASKQKATNKPTNSNAITNKIPTIIPKPNQKNPKIPHYMKNKHQQPKQHKWSCLPSIHLQKIIIYACQNVFQVYKFTLICSLWRQYFFTNIAEYFWNTFKGFQTITSFNDFQQTLKQFILKKQQQMSYQYQQYFTKLFNYGSTKQNIPNKLITKLNLQLQITLNKKIFLQPFKLKTFNFSSYLCTKILQINQFQYDFYSPYNPLKDKINISLNFKSLKYKVSHIISKTYIPQQIVDSSIKQKAFNYYLDKNFVFTHFQGDTHFLYIFFQISLLQLVNIFRSIIKFKHQQSLSKKNKKLPLYKQLCQTQFDNFQQYIKFQADFQIHFSYHNSLKQIFTHCDTKVFPLQYTKQHAYFDVKINDSFEKIPTYKLDNKMGMSQSIQDLYLLDFVLKDRDKFLIIFSGFIYARQATQLQRQSMENYFQIAQNQIKILQSKQSKYKITFFIVQEDKRYLLKNTQFTLFA